MNKYRPVCKIGEGTFSDVLKMLSLKDGKYYACKCMKQHFKSIEQVNSLCEIQALRRLSPHPNILTLHEVVFDRKAGCLSLICELMDMNIYELIKGRRKPLPEKKIKNYMYQLCKSLDHIHRNGIFHRDVKPENILIKQNTLKLADFGSCRMIYSKQPYTEYISTRWYRAPECLLTNGYYSYKMDIWSAGCVFYEITSFQPLFPGSNDLDQISKIHDAIGTPANRTLNKFKQSTILNFHFPFKKGKGIPPMAHSLPAKGLTLLYAMIKYDPDERIAAHQALQHPYFQELWAADKQALAAQKKVRFLENTVGQVPLRLWQTSKGTQREHSLRKAQDKAKCQHGLPCGELPMLSPSAAANLPPPSTPASHSVFPAAEESGEVSVLQSIRSIGSSMESEKKKTLDEGRGVGGFQVMAKWERDCKTPKALVDSLNAVQLRLVAGCALQTGLLPGQKVAVSAPAGLFTPQLPGQTGSITCLPNPHPTKPAVMGFEINHGERERTKVTSFS